MTFESENLEEHDHPEAKAIRIRGQLLPPENELEQVLNLLDLHCDKGCGRIILNLSEVKYISSSGLGWLIRLRRQLKPQGRYLHQPDRLGTVFAFFHDESEVLEAIRQGESEHLLLCGLSPELRNLFYVCGS